MRKQYGVAALAALVLSAPLVLGACGESKPQAAQQMAEEKKDDHGEEGLIALSPEEINRAGIRVETIAEADVQDELTVTATVKPNQDAVVRIAPRVPGRLAEMPARLGDNVSSGQVLAVLDSVEVGEAHSAYLLALTESQVAEAAFKRAERLSADQVIPAKEFQRAKADYDKARAQLVAASDKLRMLGVNPRGVPGEAAVSTFPLVAPRSGTIIEKNARLGELAKPDEPVFTLADLSTLWIEADIAESDLARVRSGARARVSVAAYPDRSFDGKVTYVGAFMDKETRTVRARVEVPNPQGLLKPEMFASARIETAGARKVIALPQSAVTLIQGLPVVFVEEAEGFTARAIEAGDRLGGQVIVKSGLRPGDMVVVEGVYALKARQLKSQLGEGHAH